MHKNVNKNLFAKVNTIILRNFHDYWKDPIVNKYFQDDASEKFEGFLILKKGKKPLFIAHPFNYAQVKKEYKKINCCTYTSQEEIKNILKKTLGKKVGYNAPFYSAHALKNLKKLLGAKTKIIDVSEELGKSREIKNEKEIELISKAANETEKVILEARSWLYSGMTEKELEIRIKRKFEKDGFETGFCIVSFEENTANIHHCAGQKKLEQGFVLIDAGAKYKGYCSDVTRTYYYPKETREFAIVEINVKECMHEIEKKLKDGTKAKELIKIVKKYKLSMPHSLGHGVGIEVHDYPLGINEKSKTVLKEGMVVAIEPATYTEKFGYRYENTYLITKNGAKKL